MKSRVLNTIPGRKAKDVASEKKPTTPVEATEAGEELPKAPKPEARETPDDKIQKAEARKEFDAKIRGKLKYSRKR